MWLLPNCQPLSGQIPSFPIDRLVKAVIAHGRCIIDEEGTALLRIVLGAALSGEKEGHAVAYPYDEGMIKKIGICWTHIRWLFSNPNACSF